MILYNNFHNSHDPLQPGCWSIICAHGRSYEFFAETVYPGFENNFIAIRCNSLKALKAGKCNNSRKVSMGIATPKSARGNHFLTTNSKSPYGQGLGRLAKMRHLHCKPLRLN